MSDKQHEIDLEIAHRHYHQHYDNRAFQNFRRQVEQAIAAQHPARETVITNIMNLLTDAAICISLRATGGYHPHYDGATRRLYAAIWRLGVGLTTAAGVYLAAFLLTGDCDEN